MAFTQEEENVLRLMLNEVITRKKLDIERAILSTEIRSQTNPIDAQIRLAHEVKLSALMTDFNAANKALEDNFKV